jgi:hypothetical protein
MGGECDQGNVDAPSTWEKVEFPLLDEIRRAELEGREPEIFKFFEQRGIEQARAAVIVDRLKDDDLIDGTFIRAMSPRRLPPMAHVHLTPRGARAIGMWPSADQASAFLSALAAAVDEAEEPKAKSRLSAALGALKELPTSVLAQMIVESARRHGAIP